MRNEIRSTVAVLILTLAVAAGAFAQDQPTIMKDWVQVTAFTVNHQKGNYDVWYRADEEQVATPPKAWQSVVVPPVPSVLSAKRTTA